MLLHYIVSLPTRRVKYANYAKRAKYARSATCAMRATLRYASHRVLRDLRAVARDAVQCDGNELSYNSI